MTLWNARNIKSCFLGKIRKLFQNVICWNFYPEYTWTYSIPIHVPQYLIHIENLPWAYRFVGIYVHKTYRKFGAHINCNIRTSCMSQFSLISILLNINKASKHCDCRRIITNAHSQCIEVDRGSLRGARNLIIFLPRGMRILSFGYCIWSFSHYPITDDHVV